MSLTTTHTGKPFTSPPCATAIAPPSPLLPSAASHRRHAQSPPSTSAIVLPLRCRAPSFQPLLAAINHILDVRVVDLRHNRHPSPAVNAKPWGNRSRRSTGARLCSAWPIHWRRFAGQRRRRREIGWLLDRASRRGSCRNGRRSFAGGRERRRTGVQFSTENGKLSLRGGWGSHWDRESDASRGWESSKV